MAGMEAISSLAGLSLSGMTASKGTAAVSANGAKQFEQFLNQGNSKNQDTKSVESVKETKDNVYTVNRDYTRNDRISEKTVETKNDTVSNGEDAMQMLQSGIRELVKENLGLDDETLDAVLESMGIMLTDLFNPAVLQQFVLFVNGGQESTDFLMNEDMLQSFTNLMQVMEDFKEDNQSLIVSMMEKLEEPVTLDEFLEQEGTGLTAEEAFVSEEAGAFEYADDVEAVVVTENTADTAKAVQTQQVKSGVRESGTQQSADTDDIQSEEVSEKEPVFENLSESDDTEDDMQEEQNANDVLFAERDDISGEDGVMNPLFSDKFDSFLQDGIRFLKAENGATQKMQQMIDIVNQVSERIRSTVSADTSSVEMQLNPESLGKVVISVSAKQGVMTATFRVQSEEAKNALESQIITLRENLEAKNLKVESVEVQVSDFSFAQSNQAEGQEQSDYETKSNKKFRYDFDEEVETDDEASAEAVRRQVMRDSGGSIDFTA